MTVSDLIERVRGYRSHPYRPDLLAALEALPRDAEVSHINLIEPGLVEVVIASAPKP